jgi:superfamily II DNA or RNA helicase
MRLREYQQNLLDQITAIKGGNILAVLPTGAGKTVLFSKLVALRGVPTVVNAHRHELVVQISVALAREGLRHAILGQRSAISAAVIAQRAELGAVLYDPDASTVVASVDTLARKTPRELGAWALSVQLYVQDEAHHILRSNKWGKAAALFPNAQVLGVTATPVRADGRGLGSHADGIFDHLVIGPSGRELIDARHLSQYRIFAPRTADLDLSDVEIGSTGDYKPPQLQLAIRRSRVVGDVVEQYQKLAPGLLGVTFVTDTTTGAEIADAYRAAGIPAECVTHKTGDAERAAILARFRRREVLQLINVDLFGEGFDLPAIEVVSFARPTASYGLYAQQFGRALRPMPGKGAAIIIDHVGNVLRHGLPDAPRVWTLDARDRRAAKDKAPLIPIKACTNCTAVYPREKIACPLCGWVEVPVQRNGPEWVDGDLYELDAETLDRLSWGKALRDQPAAEYRESLLRRGCPQIGAAALTKKHIENQEAQAELREAILRFGGAAQAHGISDRESWKRFYIQFGVDILTAQGLRAKEARELKERIEE